MTHPGRFHLLLTLDGQPVAHGWWNNETVARRKYTQTVGQYGRAGAHVTLTDETSGQLLTEWPEQE
ncbi:hypothetical protein ACGFZR_15310 [Streptomyces sp. NPDC048241]|uniref:hypothetical protein n=1 Tax=Streptomyces sp. NPDC048241 TaxID=3365521 RepID=UPI0037205425